MGLMADKGKTVKKCVPCGQLYPVGRTKCPNCGSTDFVFDEAKVMLTDFMD